MGSGVSERNKKELEGEKKAGEEKKDEGKQGMIGRRRKGSKEKEKRGAAWR